MIRFRSSRSEEVYETEYEPPTEEKFSCTCNGFRRHQTCVHVETLRRWADWGHKPDPDRIYPPPTSPGAWKVEDVPFEDVP